MTSFQGHLSALQPRQTIDFLCLIVMLLCDCKVQYMRTLKNHYLNIHFLVSETRFKKILLIILICALISLLYKIIQMIPNFELFFYET